MGTIRRCSKCGRVIDHTVHNPGGLCDSCDEKASPAYRPNGGTYPYINETDEERERRWNSDYQWLKNYNQQHGISPYFTPSRTIAAVDPNENKYICWKCKSAYPNRGLRAGNHGLCINCSHEGETAGVFICGALLIFLVKVFVNIFGFTTGSFIADYVISFIGLLVSGAVLLIGGSIAFWLLGKVGKFLKWAWGWLAALTGLAKDAHGIYQQKIHEDAVERAKLAEPQRLSGQELDALLTEEYKKQRGWD